MAGNNYYKLEYYRMAFKNKGDHTVLLIPRVVKLKRVKLQWKWHKNKLEVSSMYRDKSGRDQC